MSKLTIEGLKQGILDAYLVDGKDHTAAELAERLGVSEATVRKVLNQCGGCPPGFDCEQMVRPRYERNYGAQSGVYKVWVYGPSRDTLRAVLSAATGITAHRFKTNEFFNKEN